MSVINNTAVNRNSALQDIFRKMAMCYRYLDAEHYFRAAAYEEAASTMGSLREDIEWYMSDKARHDQLKGIGERISEKILEYINTGKIAAFEELKQQAPVELLELMDITGFGPATVRALHNRLGINNRDELVAAILEGRLEKAGFSARKLENIKRGLKLYKDERYRMRLWDALQAGEEILRAIEQVPDVERAVLAGSIRRRRDTIGDIDIVVQADNNVRKRLVTRLTRLRLVDRVIASGDTRIGMILRENQVQVDIRIVEEDSFGAALLYFTGCREHTINLRTLAKSKGCKLNEYGLFNAQTGAYIAGRTEEEIYRRLGMQYIAPEMREEMGELEMAVRHQLPALVTFSQIKGDMHMHSLWSDGNETIGSIAHYVLNAFPHYEYIVITDHSSGKGNGSRLKAADFVREFEEIDSINERLGFDFVKKGVEVNVLEDGSLDLPDELLHKFEWVIAAIHDGYSRDNTRRIISACQHPEVNCIAHPSGRLIGNRTPYRVDWEQVLEAAATTGTALEINAQPWRLDLGTDLVKMALQKGVRLVIDSDAHSPAQFDFMQLGVGTARRSGCSRQDIVNTWDWDTIAQFRKRKHQNVTI